MSLEDGMNILEVGCGFKGIITNDILKDYFSVQKRKECFVKEFSKSSPRTTIIFEGNEPAGLISFG